MSEIKTPVKAIRAFCLSCVGTSNEVKLCVSKNCPLFPYRLGHRPGWSNSSAKAQTPEFEAEMSTTPYVSEECEVETHDDN